MSCRLIFGLFFYLLNGVCFGQIEEVPQEVGAVDNYDKIDKVLKRNNLNYKLDTFITLISNDIKKDPNDAQALYFMGYLLGRQQCPDGNSIPKMTLNSTLEICDFLERAVIENPMYSKKKLVSDPYSKIASELSSLALRYMLESKIDSVQYALKLANSKKGFSEFNIKFAETILQNCPKDAILVSTGDLISYSILYCQIVKKIRTDVISLNSSLLASDWYFKMIKSSNDIKTSLDDKYIDSTLYIPWNVQDIKLSKSKITVKPEYDAYLVRNNIILLDIIQQNEAIRPIIFTSTISKQEIKPFMDNLILSGMFYQFRSESKSVKDNINDIYSLFDFMNLIDPTKYSDNGIILATADAYLYKNNFSRKTEVCQYIDNKAKGLEIKHATLRQSLFELFLKNCKN